MPITNETRSARVCRAFKAAQSAQGYTQADVAKRLKVQQATISRWYNSPDEMTLGNFRLLCQVLSISPQDILSIK